MVIDTERQTCVVEVLYPWAYVEQEGFIYVGCGDFFLDSGLETHIRSAGLSQLQHDIRIYKTDVRDHEILLGF